VDEDIRVGAFRGQLVDIAAVGEIERKAAHRNIVLATIFTRTASRSAAVRDTRTTSQPSSASASAQARPIPFDAPVTSALRPRKPSSIPHSPTAFPLWRAILADFAPGRLVLAVEPVGSCGPATTAKRWAVSRSVGPW